MAQIITNQASLQYQYGDTNATVLSNIATAVLEQPLSVEKTSLRDEYRAGDTPTFVLRIVNSGNAALNNVTVRDDLGTFPVGGGSVTPYAFLPNAILFIDGVNNGPLTPTGGEDGIVFTIPTLPADTTALIVYEVALTEGAPVAAGDSITNTVTATADGLTDSARDSFTAVAAEYADVTITKTMTPSVVDGGRIVYTFDIENRGNAEAENIVLRRFHVVALVDPLGIHGSDFLEAHVAVEVWGHLRVEELLQLRGERRRPDRPVPGEHPTHHGGHP